MRKVAERLRQDYLSALRRGADPQQLFNTVTMANKYWPFKLKKYVLSGEGDPTALLKDDKPEAGVVPQAQGTIK